MARAYAGLSQSALGNRIGKSQGFIARLESWEFDVTPYREAISHAAGVPIEFLNKERMWRDPESPVSFRKRAACPASVRERAIFLSRVADALAEPFVRQFIEYPVPQVPLIPATTCSSPTEARAIGAEAARAVREEWGIGAGPITNVTRLVESKGVRVWNLDAEAEHLDGFAFWINSNPHILINSRTADPGRLRLDVAHELGHLVMHRDVEMEGKAEIYEQMAFGFAIEFLAPWTTFRGEAPAIPDIQKLGALKSRWKVSMQSMVMHMHSNGAISDSAYAYAFRKFSSLGWRRNVEPGWFPLERSIIHDSLVKLANDLHQYLPTIAESHGIPERLLGEMIPATIRYENPMDAIGFPSRLA